MKLKLTDYRVTDLILSNYKEIHTSVNVSSGVLDIDLNRGNVFLINLDQNVSNLNILNVPNLDNIVIAFTMVITTTATNLTISWPVGVRWPNSAPAILSTSNNKTDFFSFVTFNKGINWFGFTGGQNY